MMDHLNPSEELKQRIEELSKELMTLVVSANPPPAADIPKISPLSKLNRQQKQAIKDKAIFNWMVVTVQWMVNEVINTRIQSVMDRVRAAAKSDCKDCDLDQAYERELEKAVKGFKAAQADVEPEAEVVPEILTVGGAN